MQGARGRGLFKDTTWLASTHECCTLGGRQGLWRNATALTVPSSQAVGAHTTGPMLDQNYGGGGKGVWVREGALHVQAGDTMRHGWGTLPCAASRWGQGHPW